MSEFKKLHFSVREHVNWYDPDTKHTLIADEDNKVIGMVLPKHIHYGELFAAAPEMLEALKIGRRAIGEHHKPTDCYATGPLTGNHFADLVQCPACLFIHMYDATIAKAEGRQAS